MRVISMPRVIAALATFALVSGCSDTTGPDFREEGQREVLPTGGMTIAPTGATLFPGQTVVLRAYLITSSGDALASQAVSWISSNPSVASVSQRGEVRALTAGHATITAQALGRAQVAHIHVVSLGGPGKPLPIVKPNIHPAHRGY